MMGTVWGWSVSTKDIPERVVNPMTRLNPQLIETKRPKALVRRRVDMISDMMTQDTAPNPMANPTTNMSTANTAMYPWPWRVKNVRPSQGAQGKRGEEVTWRICELFADNKVIERTKSEKALESNGEEVEEKGGDRQHERGSTEKK
jgi:hypothetical protein